MKQPVLIKNFKKFKYLSKVPEIINVFFSKKLSKKIINYYETGSKENQKLASDILAEIDRYLFIIYELEEFNSKAFPAYDEGDTVDEEYSFKFMSKSKDYIEEYFSTKISLMSEDFV